MTAALKGNEWSAARRDRTLPPGKMPYPFYRRLGGPQGRFGRAENLVPTGILFRTVQPVVSRYIGLATGPPQILTLLKTVLTQNYFTFKHNICQPEQSACMSPISSIIVGTFLQHFEDYHHHHHRRRHISFTELGHLLTRSGLTYPEVSSKVYHDSFCQSDSSVSLLWVIYFEAFYLHVVSSFSCIPVVCPKLVLFLTPLQFVHLFCYLSQVYPAVLLMYFISAAVILLASLALIVQVSLPYNKTGRASVLDSFILVLLRGLLVV